MGIENTEAFSLLQMNNHTQFFLNQSAAEKLLTSVS